MSDEQSDTTEAPVTQRPTHDGSAITFKDVCVGILWCLALLFIMPIFAPYIGGSGVLYAAIIDFVLLGYALQVLERRKQPLRWHWWGWRRLVTELGLAAAISFSIGGIFSIIGILVGDRPSWEEGPWPEMIRSESILEPVLYILLAVSISVVAEELFFRRLLYAYLRARIGMLLAAIAQAAIFALLHREADIDLVLMFVTGIILAAVYEWRKTLLAPIFLHAASNAMWAVIVLSMMLSYGARSHLGIGMEDGERGVRISSVSQNHTAGDLSLEEGDVITHFNSKRTSDPAALKAAIEKQEPGDAVTLKYLRDGESHKASGELTAYRPNVLW